jgi:RecA-family ATPase
MLDYGTDYPDPLVDEERQTTIDRRYLELHGQLLDADGLRKIEPPSPLIENYLFHDSLAWLGGKPGHGKSFTAVDLACCVGTGTPWHSHAVAQGVVVYVIAEGASGLAQRVDAWSLAHGQQVRNVLFLPVPAQLMDPIDTAAIAEMGGNLDADLLILDTQARVTVGAEENSSRDMGRFVDNLEKIRRHTGACVMPVHHEPRNGENLRGSTALEGAATTILRVSKDGDVVELTNPKQKDTPEQAPILLALTPVGSSAILSHEAVGIAGFTT